MFSSMRRALQDFRQKSDERYHEAGDRFHDLIVRCPYHGFEKSRLVSSFYNWLTDKD